VLPWGDEKSCDSSPSLGGGGGGNGGDSSNRQSGGNQTFSNPNLHGGRTPPTPSGLLTPFLVSTLAMMSTKSCWFGLPGFAVVVVGVADPSPIIPSSSFLLNWSTFGKVHGNLSNSYISSSSSSSSISTSGDGIGLMMHDDVVRDGAGKNKANVHDDDDQEEPIEVFLITKDSGGLAKSRYENNNEDEIDKGVIDDESGGITMTTQEESSGIITFTSAAPSTTAIVPASPQPQPFTGDTNNNGISENHPTQHPPNRGGVCECYCPCLEQISNTDYEESDQTSTSSSSGMTSGGGIIEDEMIFPVGISSSGSGESPLLFGHDSGSSSGQDELIMREEFSGSGQSEFHSREASSSSSLSPSTTKRLPIAWNTEGGDELLEDAVPTMDNLLKDLTDENYIPVFHPLPPVNCTSSSSSSSGGGKN